MSQWAKNSLLSTSTGSPRPKREGTKSVKQHHHHLLLLLLSCLFEQDSPPSAQGACESLCRVESPLDLLESLRPPLAPCRHPRLGSRRGAKGSPRSAGFEVGFSNFKFQTQPFTHPKALSSARRTGEPCDPGPLTLADPRGVPPRVLSCAAIASRAAAASPERIERRRSSLSPSSTARTRGALALN